MKTLLTALCLLFSGCMSVSTQELASLNCGPSPGQAVMETKARSHFNAVLKDSESARIKFHEARRAWQKDGSLRGGTLHGGWLLVAEVNAKNSYGGYTGFQNYYLFFENGVMYRLEQFHFDNRMAGFVEGN